MAESRLRKICIIMPGHWTYKMGGAEYQVKCIMDALISSKKYEIYFITRNVDPSYVPVGYKIILINRVFRDIRYRYLCDAFGLYEALTSVKPDIVYQRRGLAYTGFAVYYIRKKECKFIWHIAHDDDVTPMSFGFSIRGLSRYLEKRLIEYGISRADVIIAQTRDQSEYLELYYGKTPSAIVNNFHPQPKENVAKGKTVHIVWIANLKPMKQPNIFLKLADELSAKRCVRFTMIGSLGGGDWGRSMGAMINEQKVVNYIGAVCQDKVNSILSEADILVNTSKREGFSNTFIQAWMRCVPVVSLFVNPDKVFDRERLGFCSGSYSNMVNDVLRLIDNRKLRAEMGDYAQEYAFDHHSEKEVYKLLAHLQ